MSTENIPYENFKEYQSVQDSGVVNMCDLNSVSKLTGLNRAKLLIIMKEYKSLDEKWRA